MQEKRKFTNRFKQLKCLCEVTKSDVRTQTSKNALFRMDKNFKNEIFYTRLRKFKQRQKNFTIFMRGYENLNKDRNDLKTLYSETHENFKNQMFYVRLI